MVLGDRAADLDDRCFLEGVGTDDLLGHLPGDGHHRHTVHLGIGERGDEVGGPRSAGGHADPDPAGAASESLGGKSASLFVSRQDGPEPVRIVDQRLVQRHAGSAGVGEDVVDTLLDERFDKNVGAGKALCAAGSGTVILGGGHGFGLDQLVALERPDSAESACQRRFRSRTRARQSWIQCKR